MLIKHTPISCNIYESYLEVDQEIINFINNLNYTKEQMLSSFFNKNKEKDMEFKTLFKKLYGEWVIKFLKKILEEKLQQLDLVDIWCQKYIKESRHGIHVHNSDNSLISFIWYIDCSPKSANTIFYNPGFPHCSYFEKSVKPEKNKIIFFDSYIPHEVENNNDTKRCIISGNFKISK